MDVSLRHLPMEVSLQAIPMEVSLQATLLPMFCSLSKIRPMFCYCILEICATITKSLRKILLLSLFSTYTLFTAENNTKT